MNWIGISNENEFYSQHYLSEIFSGDVRGVLEAWAEQETQARESARANNQKEPDYRAPYTRLNSIWREALNQLDSLQRPQPPSERVTKGRAVIRQLLQIFDLPYQPTRQPLSGNDDWELPLPGELRTPQDEPLLWVLEAQALDEGDEFDADPLSLRLHAAQLTSLSHVPVAKALTAANAPDLPDNRNLPGIRLATMHRVKGLEFKAVFMVAINHNIVPLRIGMTSQDSTEANMRDQNERALFHVAATRAIKYLSISSHGKASEYFSI